MYGKSMWIKNTFHVNVFKLIFEHISVLGSIIQFYLSQEMHFNLIHNSPSQNIWEGKVSSGLNSSSYVQQEMTILTLVFNP